MKPFILFHSRDRIFPRRDEQGDFVSPEEMSQIKSGRLCLPQAVGSSSKREEKHSDDSPGDQCKKPGEVVR